MRSVLSVAYPLHPDTGVLVVEHDEKASTDDADIVLFRLPTPPITSSSTYKGKPNLPDYTSFAYKETLAHWRKELANAISDGKTVVVELRAPIDVYVSTGDKQYSGTGRSRVTTRIVELTSNYAALPVKLPTLSPAHGTVMKLAPKSDFLNSYWNAFAHESFYDVRLAAGEKWQPLITTQSSDRIVGALFTGGRGNLILLPPIVTFSPDITFKNQPAPTAATKKKHAFQLLEHILKIDEALRLAAERQPPPDWVQTDAYTTPRLASVRAALATVEDKQKALQDEQARLLEEHGDAQDLHLLLYGTGKPLERAVIRSLRLMGFKADEYTDMESQFDTVFEADGRRLLGEAEGRDNGPITIDKITQLERNVAEDFAKDEVNDYAKGVLFGNPQRLIAPTERTVDFTTKCFSSGKRNHFAMVLTASMFGPSAYLESASDEDYARQCRDALFSTDGGVVQFPETPIDEGRTMTEVASASPSKTSRPRRRRPPL